MDNDEKVLQIVKEKGPLLPIHIVKEIGGDTILIGAILSTLSEKGLIKVSSSKIGGSPLYYIAGQEPKLEVLYKYLHEKEQKAYNLLKEKKVLRDVSLEPVIRVALRNIKDFAKPLEVKIGNKEEIFWKWCLCSNSEVEPLIKEQLRLVKEFKPEKKEIKEEKEIEERVEKKEKIPKKPESAFFESLNDYFQKNNIEIIEKTVIKKNKEIDFTIKVPSAVGHSIFYCKVKDKKRLTEADLSTAFVQGESRKLPVLFLTNGEPNKRAKEMLTKEFRNFIIKNI